MAIMACRPTIYSVSSQRAGPLFTVWYTAYRSIGHSLFLLFFGLVGGWVTVYFYRKRQRMLAK